MFTEELSTIFEAARETFKVENGQLTEAHLVKIRAIITSILLLAPYEKEKGDYNIVGLVWSTSKYMDTQMGISFSIHTRPAIYDPSIADDKKMPLSAKRK